MKSTLINVASGSDTMSMVSGLDALSMDSGPDTEFNFGDMQSKAAGKKKKPDQATEDIENVDLGGSGLVSMPKPEQRKNFNSYRKRLQATQAKQQSYAEPTQPAIEEDFKGEDNEGSMASEIEGINRDIEQLEQSEDAPSKAGGGAQD